MEKLLNFILVCIVAIPTLAASQSKPKTQVTPTHLVFMVFDQMRPDYIDRFHLKNFQQLRRHSLNYSEARVGHLASVTVVSHAVMTTGLAPKDLPWSENVFWDRQGLIGEKDKTYNTLTLGQERQLKLLSTLPADQFLIKRFKDKTAKKVFAVGEKNYATVAMGGPYSDALIYAEKKEKQCVPSGANVPDYISQNNRYTINCSETYGTENSLYPLDGNHFYPGKDSAHLGGDIWVADIALDIMNHEKNWGALFLTFGAIDKFGHMLGETDGETPHAFETPAHLKDIAEVADQQLGRVLAELKKQKLLEQTMIVITADHGGQTDDVFLGSPGAGEPFWIQRVAQMAPLRFNTVDTGIRLWLKENTPAHLEKSVKVLQEVQQVRQVFTLDRSQTPVTYKLAFERWGKNQAKARLWAQKNNLDIINSSAGPNGADLVAVLDDNVGFGKLGDHGGLQEKVQRIPMLVSGPGIKTSTNKNPVRLRDLAPLINDKFQLNPPPQQ